MVYDLTGQRFGRLLVLKKSDGYFICSIGNVSEKQLRKYIENQV